VKLFRGPGLRLERAGWFFARISWELACGPAMGAGEVPSRVFSSLSLRPASPVGFSSVSTGGLFVAFIRLAVFRAGFFEVCSTWNVWALILWFVVCQGRLAGPDGPAAFFV